MVRLFDKQLSSYQEEHTTSLRKMAHYAGIPALLMGLLIVLSWISLSVTQMFHVTFSSALVIALIVYYFFVNTKLGLVMAPILLILLSLCSWIALPSPGFFNSLLVLVGVLGGGGFQFFSQPEGHQPALFSSVSQALVAPIFLLSLLIERFGCCSFVKKALEGDDRSDAPEKTSSASRVVQSKQKKPSNEVPHDTSKDDDTTAS